MSSRGYKQSAEHIRKRMLAHIGLKHSDASKRNMSLAHIGKATWNKGLSMRESTKEKLRLANLGKKQSPEAKAKQILNQLGKRSKPRITVHCAYCGEEKKVLLWFANRSKHHFCNRSHHDAWQRAMNAPNWKGGIAENPYTVEFSRSLKQKIRKRDNYACRECNQTENQLGYKLSIHHIDYNKNNSVEDNLISLCRSCHSQTNFKRTDWTNYFKRQII